MKLTKNFRINIILRVLIISGMALLLAWTISDKEWLFTPIVITIILIVLIANLIYYVEKTNRNLTQFLYSLKQGGFTNLFKERGRGRSYQELNEVFNAVTQQFQKITVEKEAHYQYLKTLNENLEVALISFNKKGEIQFLNPAAKALLVKPIIKTIHDIEKINPEIFNAINVIGPDESRVIKTVVQDALVHLSIQVKEIVVNNEISRLVLIQNIHNEMEEKEVESWQKLISVLTHEIMNSVTPIASLSGAINQQITNEGFQLSKEDEKDIVESLNTIESRSKGLMRFVNAYKEFTRKPDLNIAEIDLKELATHILQLLSPAMEEANIRHELIVESGSFKIRADRELIEQVIINLIKNAIEVVQQKEQPKITLRLSKRQNRVILEVMDNGPGIEKETLDRIFVPFYTTKKQGTGIGLSFARQIMRLHNGSITVKSQPGEGATFQLSF